jgi:hypothetical protein
MNQNLSIDYSPFSGQNDNKTLAIPIKVNIDINRNDNEGFSLFSKENTDINRNDNEGFFLFSKENTICSSDNSIKKEIVLLPNLKLKNNKIYFTLMHPTKIFIKKKNTHINDFLIDNVSMHGSTIYNSILINYDILNEELEKGLKIKIMYNENDFLYKKDIQKIAKNIESYIIGIEDNNVDAYNISDEIEYKNYSDTDSISYEEDTYNDTYNDTYDDTNNDTYDDTNDDTYDDC